MKMVPVYGWKARALWVVGARLVSTSINFRNPSVTLFGCKFLRALEPCSQISPFLPGKIYKLYSTIISTISTVLIYLFMY